MYGNAKERKNPYVEKRNIFVLLAANAVSYLPDIVFYDCDFPCKNVFAEYIKNAVWLWSGWIIIQRIFVWILTKWYVRKVEGKDER